MTDTVIIEFYPAGAFIEAYVEKTHDLHESLDASGLRLYNSRKQSEPAYLAVSFGSEASMMTFKTTWTGLFNDVGLFKYMVAAKILPSLPQDAQFRTVIDDGSE